jgi:hypothetical protein
MTLSSTGEAGGPHSMISLGTVAVNRAGKELAEFEIIFHLFECLNLYYEFSIFYFLIEINYKALLINNHTLIIKIF